MGKVTVHFRSLTQTDFYDNSGWSLSANNNFLEIDENEWATYLHLKKQFEAVQTKLIEKIKNNNWKNCEHCGNGFIPKNNKKTEHIVTPITMQSIDEEGDLIAPQMVELEMHAEFEE